MRHSVLVAIVGLLAGAAQAADPQRIDAALARTIAEPAVQSLANVPDLPLKIDPDLDRITGLEADKRGALVVPAKGLTAEMIEKADKDVVPVGYLLLHRITLVAVDHGLRLDEHRTATITVDGKTVELPVIQLGVARTAGRMVLVAYTNKKEATIVTTLGESADAKDFPIDLDARGAGDNQAKLTLTILSRFRASLDAAGLE